MKIIAEYTDYDLNDYEDMGEEMEYEQECSTPDDALNFVMSRVDDLTPDGHQVALTNIFFYVGDKRFYLDEVSHEAGDDDIAEAVNGGYLREMDITAEQMTHWFESAERMAAQA